MPARSIVKIACGGMHTLALSSDGSLFSWGCNDEGVLGRSGAENVPLRVDASLNTPVNDISTGDSHAVAYNTKTNQMYFWGCYRVSPILNQIIHVLIQAKILFFRRYLLKFNFLVHFWPNFNQFLHFWNFWKLCFNYFDDFASQVWWKADMFILFPGLSQICLSLTILLNTIYYK